MDDPNRPWKPIKVIVATLACGHERKAALRLPSEQVNRDALFCYTCSRHVDVVDRRDL